MHCLCFASHLIIWIQYKWTIKRLSEWIRGLLCVLIMFYVNVVANIPVLYNRKTTHYIKIVYGEVALVNKYSTHSKKNISSDKSKYVKFLQVTKFLSAKIRYIERVKLLYLLETKCLFVIFGKYFSYLCKCLWNWNKSFLFTTQLLKIYKILSKGHKIIHSIYVVVMNKFTM